MTKKRLRGVSKWRHKMSSSARQELLSSVKNRYLVANRHKKSKILDELCASTGFHRKHAIRTLNNFVEKQPYYEGRGCKKNMTIHN
jgi:predicted transcriptional regulator YheO